MNISNVREREIQHAEQCRKACGTDFGHMVVEQCGSVAGSFPPFHEIRPCIGDGRTEYTDDDGDDIPIAAVHSSRRSQNQTSKKVNKQKVGLDKIKSEDEFLNKQLTNTTTEDGGDDGDDKPIAAKTHSSRRSQTQTSKKSKQTEVEDFSNKQLTNNAEAADISDDDDEPLAALFRNKRFVLNLML